MSSPAISPAVPRRRVRPAVALLAGLCAVAVSVGTVIAAKGPSSSNDPYIVPVAPGVAVTSILTVGDSIGPYQMVGIPDGLGAFDNDDGTFTLLMNHEIAANLGGVRAHGAIGAFVSRWVIDPDTLTVQSGGDLIQKVATWNSSTDTWNAPASGVVLGRLCSADLPARKAFYNPGTRKGYDGPIFMDGEEVGAEGRAFGHLMDGTTYELPHLGKFSWENSVAHPDTDDRTVVIGTDDSTPGEVYVYVGEKRRHGNAIERAGLADGSLFGIVVKNAPVEDRFLGVGGPDVRFSLANHGDVSALTGAQLQAKDDAASVTKFLRPEDGAWDPSHPDDFYFVTTDRFDPDKSDQNANDGRSRLWRLRFDDVERPWKGGRIQLLVDGTGANQMYDNLTIDQHGHVLIQEDPGNQPHLARIWQYDIKTDTTKIIAQHDPARFVSGAPGFLTQDEESSGIIDAEDILGPGWFLLDVQAHYPNGATLVEGGQLLALYNPDSAAGG